MPTVSYLKLSFVSVCSIIVQNVMTYKGNHSGNEAYDGHTHKIFVYLHSCRKCHDIPISRYIEKLISFSTIRYDISIS